MLPVAADGHAAFGVQCVAATVHMAGAVRVGRTPQWCFRVVAVRHARRVNGVNLKRGLVHLIELLTRIHF